jgi:hypothetical protein
MENMYKRVSREIARAHLPDWQSIKQHLTALRLWDPDPSSATPIVATGTSLNISGPAPFLPCC